MRSLFVASSILLILAQINPAPADTLFFIPANDNWVGTNHWGTAVGGPGTISSPDTTDDAWVRSGRTSNFTASTGNQEVLSIGIGGASTNGTLNVSGDVTLTANSTGRGLSFGNGTTGALATAGAVLNQSGATIDIAGSVEMGWNGNGNATASDSKGVYNHSGGILLVGDDMVMTRIGVGGTNKHMVAEYNISGNATTDIVDTLFVGEITTGTGNSTDARLSITGSNASINVGNYVQVFDTADYTRLTFVADALGISTILVDSNITVGGELFIDLDDLAATPSVMVLLENGGGAAVTGAFSNVVEGQMFGDYMFTYLYDAGGGSTNSVALVAVVPEPDALLLLSGGLLGLLAAGWQRRRRRC